VHVFSIDKPVLNKGSKSTRKLKHVKTLQLLIEIDVHTLKCHFVILRDRNIIINQYLLTQFIFLLRVKLVPVLKRFW